MQQKELLAEIATSLTQTKGEGAQRALVAVKRAMDGQPLKDTEARLIGRVVSTGFLAGGYQAGNKFLRQPQ